MKSHPNNTAGTIPEFAPYPSPTTGAWNKIPLGIGAEGEVFWDVSKAPTALIAGATGGGKSVLQRNILFHCIQHPDRWRIVGIDMKSVELSPYKKYDDVVLGIANTIPEGVATLRYAKEEMANRYSEMADLGVNNYENLPNVPYALMVVIDEAYTLLAQSPDNNNEEVREENKFKKEAAEALGDIARLGRAAGVHLVITTQRPDATIIDGELKYNLSCRIVAGKVDPATSRLTLDNDNATHLPSGIRGRSYIQVFDKEEHFQSYYIPLRKSS